MKTPRAIWLLSEKGILGSDGKPLPDIPFQETPVTAGSAWKGKAAVIADKREIWTLSEGKWAREVSAEAGLLCVCWRDEDLFAGTRLARLARIKDHELLFIQGFDEAPGRKQWYTPWGDPPDVRSLAVSTDGTMYANVHVGWIVRSRDGGKTWENLQKDLEMDVHQVGTHPLKPGVVFAATASGFYVSHNHGDTFTRRAGGMPYDYQRACACFAEGEVYLVSTSRGPHGRADALLYRSEDEGTHWAPVNGLPDPIAKNIDTFQIGIVSAHRALAIVNDTALYQSDDRGLNWRAVGRDYPRLYGILVL